MNKFSASGFCKIGSLLAGIGNPFRPDLAPQDFIGWLLSAEQACREIELLQSAANVRRIINEFSKDSELRRKAEFKIKVECLQNLILSEMDAHLFFWVPSHRAEFLSKDAEAIVGAQCCARFPSIEPEITEAAKCYAIGRYTASAFHLMRSTEAAVKALAIAIGFTPAHPSWKLVFDEIWNQFKNPNSRHPSWSSHADFLVTISADLRAIGKVWRNDIAHFVDTYSEEQAKPMFEVIPLFLRDLATRMDENGTLY